MPPNISSSEPTSRANWLAALETLVIFALILLYIWWLRFRYPYAWIVILMAVWVSHLWHRESLDKLGFRWNGGRSLVAVWMVLVVIVTALLATGLMLSTMRNVPWQWALSSLALYCFWGLFQQYVLNGYFVNRLSDFLPNHPRAVPLVAAVLFSLVHAPNWFLMIVALGAGYACATIYLKLRNLYFLGLAHGLVGFLLYMVVPDTISRHLYVGPKWFSM